MNSEAFGAALNQHDQLLRSVAAGHLSVGQFVEQYENFFWAYALDGHEAESGGASLAAFALRIEPHRRVAEDVLAVLAPESEAGQSAYLAAGRIGATEALLRLKLIAQALPAGGA